MNRLLFLICLLAPVCSAQGVVRGNVVNAAGGEVDLTGDELACVVALPDTSPPWNELTATQWQAAMDSLAIGEQPLIAIGGAITPIDHAGTAVGSVALGGSFEVPDVPLNSRLGVAVKVDGLWWPSRNELRLTEESAEATIQIPYYPLGADPSAVSIEKWYIESQGSLVPDLRYAQIGIYEIIRFTNPDPDRAAMITLQFNLAIPPGLSARSLISMYGSQLHYFQGWNGSEPIEETPTGDALSAWSLGAGGGMHGSKPSYGPEPRTSADNWHPLNQNPMLATVGAGDTLYQINPSPNGRSASLLFYRPVPPAGENGMGVLEIRVLHNGGVLHLSPSGRIQLKRTFNNNVLQATARIGNELELAALVEDAHRRLYGEPTGDNAMDFPPNPDHSPSLYAGETASIVFGFTQEAQRVMDEFERGATREDAPTPGTAIEDDDEAELDTSALFKSLAVIFGLAFVGALVGTVRKGRKDQLKALAELPATRAEMIDALAQLKLDYEAKRVPPTQYQEHRQRLLNRLIELDTAPDEKDEDKEDE